MVEKNGESPRRTSRMRSSSRFPSPRSRLARLKAVRTRARVQKLCDRFAGAGENPGELLFATCLVRLFLFVVVFVPPSFVPGASMTLGWSVNTQNNGVIDTCLKGQKETPGMS